MLYPSVEQLLKTEILPGYEGLIKSSRQLLSGKGKSKSTTDAHGHPGALVAVREIERLSSFIHNTQFLFPDLIVSPLDREICLDILDEVKRIVKILRRNGIVQDYEINHVVQSMPKVLQLIIEIRLSLDNRRLF